MFLCASSVIPFPPTQTYTFLKSHILLPQLNGDTELIQIVRAGLLATQRGEERKFKASGAKILTLTIDREDF